MSTNLRFLLLQVRDAGDPMRSQEVACFARALACAAEQIAVIDLIGQAPTIDTLRRFDVVLLGGSGAYSVASGGPWLDPALDAMRELVTLAKPTFASCWGFQAMARALGGKVVTDLARAELGTLSVQVTPEGGADPLFSSLGSEFLANMGHQDIVEVLPPGAVRLASTEKVANQAFCLPGKPIYCTQFHPELDREALLERIRAYPQYIERISGLPLEQFERMHCFETPAAGGLLRRFLKVV